MLLIYVLSRPPQTLNTLAPSAPVTVMVYSIPESNLQYVLARFLSHRWSLPLQYLSNSLALAS